MRLTQLPAIALSCMSYAQSPIEFLDQRTESVVYSKVITVSDTHVVIGGTLDLLDSIRWVTTLMSRSIDGTLLWEDTLLTAADQPSLEWLLAGSDGASFIAGGSIIDCSLPFFPTGHFVTRYALDGDQIWHNEYTSPRIPWAVLPDGRSIVGNSTMVQTITPSGIDLAPFAPPCSGCLRSAAWWTGDTLLLLSNEYLMRFTAPANIVDTVCSISNGVGIIRSRDGHVAIERSDDLIMLDTSSWTISDTLLLPVAYNIQRILLSDSATTFIYPDSVRSYSTFSGDLSSFGYDMAATSTVRDADMVGQGYIAVGLQHIWHTNGGLMKSYSPDWIGTNHLDDISIAFSAIDTFYVEQSPLGSFTPYFQGSVSIINHSADTLKKATLDHRRIIYSCGTDSDLFPLDTIAIAPEDSLVVELPLLTGYAVHVLPGDTEVVFICIRAAAPNDRLDDDLSGNYICLTQEVTLPLWIQDQLRSAPRLFPNPTYGELFLDSEPSTGPVDFTLTDLNGRIIRSGRWIEQAPIDIEDVCPGTYIIEIVEDYGGKRSTHMIAKL